MVSVGVYWCVSCVLVCVTGVAWCVCGADWCVCCEVEWCALQNGFSVSNWCVCVCLSVDVNCSFSFIFAVISAEATACPVLMVLSGPGHVAAAHAARRQLLAANILSQEISMGFVAVRVTV